ncbi:MAG TPA: choice-of-anchor tandem repeat GloVer-containing protein [Bryobacteraceae bacterium]|jgi:hypothetical protein|nr:choice-of-anchor tandem repeat GloVer-containing protein [Bryobacteraceae bacterium]
MKIRLPRYRGAALAFAVAISGNCVHAQPEPAPSAVQFETIYQFTAGDGSGGYGSDLVSDGNGGFFGATIEGGPAVCPDIYGCGTVYHLLRPLAPDGAWTKTMIYNFTGYPNDGQNPYGPLAIAANGTLYGVTQGGGQCSYPGLTEGCGTVFSLTPPAEPGQAWTETILYRFTGFSDGYFPQDLIIGPGGVLYGTTFFGGVSPECNQNLGCGAVFSLTPPSTPEGAWTIAVLYSVEGGYYVEGATSVIMGPGQVLYGTTPGSGDVCFMHICGTVFSLTPPATPGGAWTPTVLHTFVGPPDGFGPNASLALGRNGEIYGTTFFGGRGCHCGTIFELMPPASPDSAWTETVLFSFRDNPAANRPQTGVVIGKDGALYGSTPAGGVAGCQDDYGCGTIFKLNPPASPGGVWTETIVHHFTGGSDGAEPYMTLVVGRNDELYGTTGYGGSSGYGTAFVILNP